MSRTKTLLDGVNDVLIEVRQIDSQTKLVSLTAPQTQVFVDNTVSLWKRAIQDLYTLSKIPMPIEAEEFTFSLRAETTNGNGDDGREYDLPTDLVQIRWPIEDRVNGLRIHEYPGGFEAMRIAQRIPSQWKGLPYRGCISPINRKLRLERSPQTAEAGRVYHMTYDRSVIPQEAADLMPFEDDVYEAMVSPVAAMWEMKQNGVTTELGRTNYGRASRLLSGLQMAAVY